jgi:hypothetical protein
MANDQRFAVRLCLTPKLGPRTDSDMAIEFVRLDTLTPEQLQVVETMGKRGTVIVRDQLRPVAHLGWMRPKAAAAAIEAKIPFYFSVQGEFVPSWKKLKVRPPWGDAHPTRTDERYCIYDDAYGDYLYSPAYVDKVAREVVTEAKFATFFGWNPTRK